MQRQPPRAAARAAGLALHGRPRDDRPAQTPGAQRWRVVELAMRRIRAAATARLAAVEPAGDGLRATPTTARQWVPNLGGGGGGGGAIFLSLADVHSGQTS